MPRLDNVKFARKIKSYYLDESKITKKQRQKVISNFDKLLAQLRELGLTHKGVNLIDVSKHRFMGYDVNLGSVVKSITVEKGLKKNLFLHLYAIRIWYYYKHLNSKEKRDCYEINLIDYKKTNKPKKAKKVKAAFIVSDPSYFKTLLNIFEELKKRKTKFVVIVPSKAKQWGFLEKLRNNKFCDVVFIEDYFTNKAKENLRRNADNFTLYYKSNKSKIRKSFVVDKTSLFDYTQPALKVLFTRYFPQIISFIDIADNILKDYKPDVLVGTKIRRYIENSFFYAAKNQKIKTVSIMPVIMTTDLNGYYDQGNFDIPDEIVVWDNYQKKIVNKKVHVLGSPQWDDIFNSKKKTNIKEKFVTIATQPLWKINNIKDIVEVSKELGLKPIIKPHPREDKTRYKKLDATMLTDKEADLYALLKESQIVFTAWSTVGLEAFVAGTPVILYFDLTSADPSVTEVINVYKEMGMPVPKNKAELRQSIKSSSKKKPKEAGKITQKIVNLMLKS